MTVPWETVANVVVIVGTGVAVTKALLGPMARTVIRWSEGADLSVELKSRLDKTDTRLESLDAKLDQVIERLAHIEGGRRR